MASSCGVKGVKGDEYRKLDRRLPFSYANDNMISPCKHTAITQGIKDVEMTWGTTKKFIALSGHDHRGLGEEDQIIRMDASYGKEDACRTTSEVIDGERDLCAEVLAIACREEDGRRATKGHRGRGEIMVSDGKEYVRGAEEIPGYPREIVVSDDEEYVKGTQKIVGYPSDGVFSLDPLLDSSHRDGSIFRGTHAWKKKYRIADRDETRLEAMFLSGRVDCVILNGTCWLHRPRRMFQIFSLKLNKIPVDGGSVELYGYIAIRDNLDPFLNYIVNISRDDPIIVEQGSFINMSGPKRGIELVDTILIEYDMRIKTGEQEKDDLQLIDGASYFDEFSTSNCYAFTNRIYGDCGAVDITASGLHHAVEATVEVIISEVQSSFNLCLGCFISGIDKEIRLFDGAIGESRGLKRYVVAVVMGTWMDLRFKENATSNPVEYCCSFKANNHGHATHEIKTDFALISVKVTWSTVPAGF